MNIISFVLKILYFFLLIFFMRFSGKFAIYLIARMGSFYIKLGQFLSTREDLVGEIRARFLKFLQHSVPYDKNFDIATVFNKNLARDIDVINKKPIKSASIAQVHKAILKNGDIVAIKVVKDKERRNLEFGCKRFKNFGSFLSKFSFLKRFNFERATQDITKSLLSELDMQFEARNINKFRYFFADDKKISAPFVYEQYSTKNVIVMEFIEGQTILEVINNERLDQKEKSKIASIILDSHLKQVYMDNFFHSDPHQSNLIYSLDKRVFFIDFGGYCELRKQDSIALLKIMNAFLNRNYKMVAKVHREVGYIEEGVDLFEFEEACREIGDRYLDREQFSISEVFKSLIDTGKKFKMELQPQLLMVQKTMVMIEGLVKSLDPDANPLLLSKSMINKIYARAAFRSFFLKLTEKLKIFNFFH